MPSPIAKVAGLAAVALMSTTCNTASKTQETPRLVPIEVIELPEAALDGSTSVQAALQRRRSVRQFTAAPLTREQLSQLMWAAQGQNREGGGRTAPSAGALYPIELFAVTGDGLFHYLPDRHRAEVLAHSDLRGELVEPELQPAAIFVIAAVFARTEVRYGDRAERYVELEAGHVAQNLLLQAVALGLGAVPIGAFDDDDVKATLQLPSDHAPLYMVRVGEPAE